MAAAGGAEELLSQPGWAFGWTRILLNWFGFVGNYGARIVVFTLILKLLIFPLDFYQRYMTRKNGKINERIKPQIERLKEMYPDRATFARKQMELNKKEGLRPLRACLPAIVTAVIFLTLWQTMLSVGQYQTVRSYFVLHDHFMQTRQELLIDGHSEVEATQGAQDAVRELYRNGVTRIDENGNEVRIRPVRQSFLWISSVWVPDVWWEEPIREDSDFFSSINNFYRQDRPLTRNQIRDRYDVDSWLTMPYNRGLSGFRRDYDGIYRPTIPNYEVGRMYRIGDGEYRRPTNYELFGSDFGDRAVEQFNRDLSHIMAEYRLVMRGLRDEYGGRSNGFMILTVLAVVLNFATQFLMMRMQKKAGTMGGMGMGDMGGAMGGQMQMTMKLMMFIFPVMIGFFAATSASIFAIYMVVNALGTLAFMLATTTIFYLMDKKRGRDQVVKVQKYGRPDPNE